MHRDPRVADQDVLVELTPEQLVDPGGGAGAPAVQLAAVACHGRVQTLADGDDTSREISRQLTGAGFGRQIAALVVLVQIVFDECRQAVLGEGFAGGPQRAQVVARPIEAAHLVRRHVAGDGHGLLRGRWRDARRQRHRQACKAGAAELAEHLEVATRLGEHATRREQQLVEIAAHVDSGGPQPGGNGMVTALLVDAVFVVVVQALHGQLLAELEQSVGCDLPFLYVANQQRHIERLQPARQLDEVA